MDMRKLGQRALCGVLLAGMLAGRAAAAGTSAASAALIEQRTGAV